MEKLRFIFTMFTLCLFITTNAWTQDWIAGDNVILEVRGFALIETNYAPISLSLTASTPGGIVEPSSNSNLFVKISSITSFWRSRKITAMIFNGLVPNGTILTLISAPCTTTNSGGDLGVPVATPITLGGADQKLVGQIGSCYTGTGYNDGYRMTFTWAPDATTNYSLIETTTTSVTIVFTLSEQSWF